MLWFALFALGGLLWLAPRLLSALIRRRLLGYRIELVQPDPRQPTRLMVPKKVAVIGGGLAGLAAASTLAGRGYAVEIFEKKPHLGGKIGAWKEILPSGEEVWLSHGFHAFFRHYYNLNAWLDRLGLRRSFRAIDDYLILDREGRQTRFAEVATTPGFNLLGLARRGLFPLSPVIFGPARDLMGVFLEYDPARTFERYDRLTLADFDRAAALPAGLKVAFRTFSRAFFADEDRISLAELIKSFHFYYLSHDYGLTYDYPADEYEASLLRPIRAHLEGLGVRLHLGRGVRALARTARGFSVDGEPFDKVVLAADVGAARGILEQATGLPAGPPLGGLVAGQRYAVLRLWVDRDARPDLPGFFVTDRHQLLDAVALLHRLEAASRSWAGASRAVLELHSYAVPDAMADAEVEPALLAELTRFLPELEGLQILGRSLQIGRDFTAFHRGLAAARPASDSGVPGLWFAGDWVKLPMPAMLLEAAFTSGLFAANGVLGEDGLALAPIASVPLRGLMAGIPEPPKRQDALGVRPSAEAP
ncbi:MAG: FAD-dependent oxidoreductase [Myxococcota bacterium]